MDFQGFVGNEIDMSEVQDAFTAEHVGTKKAPCVVHQSLRTTNQERVYSST